MIRFVCTATAAAVIALCAAPASAETRRYAVIVAHTDDVKQDVAPLQYADDDGARYYELFSHIADDVRLYAVLDEDSQRLYPKVAARAGVPRRAEVLSGLGQVFERIEGDVDAGNTVELYFVLVGHGNVGAGGEGYVSLLDSPFTRTDLFQEVLARSPATTNHVIVDACNSYFLVHRRGGGEAEDDAGPSRREALRAFLDREDASRYPNTGFLLSTSSEKESHEWSAYGAGVFSHQLRSALTGAADVNGDGRIEYSEVGAFVAAANARVDDPRARVELYAEAPAIDRSRPLVALAESDFRHFLRAPEGTELRFYLEDDRGVRYADAHLSGERNTVIALVPSRRYYVRTSDGTREAKIDLAVSGRFDLDPAAMKPPRIAARGAVAEAFRAHLYAEPYGPGFYQGFVASKGARAATDGPPWTPAPADANAPARAELDRRLAALNTRAASDRALARRLRSARVALIDALRRGDLDAASRVLDEVDGGGT